MTVKTYFIEDLISYKNNNQTRGLLATIYMEGVYVKDGVTYNYYSITKLEVMTFNERAKLFYDIDEAPANVYYEVTNPTIEEEIPVQLKNNAFSKLFEPITNLFSLPNYGELDPTPFLAPFFMLFFGLCLGDGGYGLLIWAVS